MKPFFWKPSTVPNKNFSCLSEKTSKGMFLKPEELQNHSNEEKGKEKKKEWGEGKEEMKKRAMVALLVFVIATLEKCKRSLGDSNTINPARYTLSCFGLFLLVCVRPVSFRPLESHTNWHFFALDLMDRRKLMSGWHPIMMPWMLQIRFVINVYVIHSTQFCHVKLICLSYLSYL